MAWRVLYTLLGLALAADRAAAVDGAVIVYGLDSPAEEAFQRILGEKSVRYVCTQRIFTLAGVPPLARKRAEALTRAGKRVVLQIWWGPGGTFPWSKYSFANLALDEKGRPDFFRDVVAFSDRVHFAEGHLTRRVKEMIATYVSALNKCKY